MYDAILKSMDPDVIMALPPPERLWPSPPEPRKLYEFAKHSYNLWLGLLDGSFGFNEKRSSVSYKCSTCALTHVASRGDAQQRLLMIIGTLFGYCAHALVTATDATDSDDFGIPGCSAAEFGALKRGSGSTVLEWSRELLVGYIGVLQASRMLYLMRRGKFSSDMYSDGFERVLADSTLDIFHVLQKETTAEGLFLHDMNVGMLVRKIMGYSLHLHSSVYRWPARPWSETHQGGPFSLLRLPELQLLARQDPIVRGRYGAKRVEKVFEFQLALLMQSFGFYVIRTRTGERTVDLVCISGDPLASFTLLLEAKTSRAAYTLPVKDERALVEYISAVNESLTTSPPLGLVLIVGADASKNLPSRLRRLELASGTPVRFCRAQELATLRELVVGPLPLGLMRSEFMRAKHIVSESCIAALVRAANSRSTAQENLVRAFLNAPG